MLAKHIWSIAVKKDTLWIRWVHSVKLRGKSIWEIQPEKDDIWGWKNLLIVRDRIKSHVVYKVGMGVILISGMIIGILWVL